MQHKGKSGQTLPFPAGLPGDTQDLASTEFPCCGPQQCSLPPHPRDSELPNPTGVLRALQSPQYTAPAVPPILMLPPSLAWDSQHRLLLSSLLSVPPLLQREEQRGLWCLPSAGKGL